MCDCSKSSFDLSLFTNPMVDTFVSVTTINVKATDSLQTFSFNSN